ncbi:MAG: hypothetical protein O7J95_03500 [Planctomycetota bacterium]|nr:hypothetical protein [Planctomycetota bacterium]
MSERLRNLTALLALGAWLPASLGVDCCLTARRAVEESCCASDRVPGTPPACSSCEEQSPTGSPVRICGCGRSARKALPTESAPVVLFSSTALELVPELPSLTGVLALIAEPLPFFCPSPPARGPPGAPAII